MHLIRGWCRKKKEPQNLGSIQARMSQTRTPQTRARCVLYPLRFDFADKDKTSEANKQTHTLPALTCCLSHPHHPRRSLDVPFDDFFPSLTDRFSPDHLLTSNADRQEEKAGSSRRLGSIRLPREPMVRLQDLVLFLVFLALLFVQTPVFMISLIRCCCNS